MGHDHIGHSYIHHDYIGQNYIGHTYTVYAHATSHTRIYGRPHARARWPAVDGLGEKKENSDGRPMEAKAVG